MDKKTNLSNYIQLGILGVLIVIAFLLGSMLTNKNSSKAVAVVPAQQGTQPTAVPALSMDDIAAKLKIKKADFDACLNLPEIAKLVDDQQASGTKSGVNGTPGAFILDTQTGKAVQLAGAVPIDMINTAFANLKAGKPDSVTLDPVTSTEYVKGNANARYALVEWSDFDCPYCKMFQSTAQQFVTANSDVKWVFRNFIVHPTARAKAIAALCAGKVGGNDMYWAFADELFNQQAE